MDSQTQDKIYVNLVKYWRLSYRSQNIIQIPNNDKFIPNIRALVVSIKNQLENSSDKLIQEIFFKTLENINFMVKDLLDARLDRIILRCRRQKKIKEEFLLPEEIDFYRGLFTSFRGYKASRNMVLDDLLTPQNKAFPKNFSSSDDLSLSDSTLVELNQKISSVTQNSDDNVQEEVVLSNMESSSKLIAPNSSLGNSGEEKMDIPEEFPYDLNLEDELLDEDTPPAEILDELDLVLSRKNDHSVARVSPQEYKSIQYTTVRILSDISPIVGVDLEIYGPLNKEDVIFLPQKNADILIEENLASMLEI
ncbi:hypothetical protein NEF87_001553 [Candidatus Lokiarchaeum ossiferum]|uniref:Gins51 C-terminal domain-containing protein n=1 Tax=Candidatus Lokiarchaeum ossiferum TaxID=2951803 RepID=A0ABY6HP22_9ARCH|nr:hypothetical protein NEF87_001553 [Candidatus Lokiarchaeum sp. B-35]